MLRSTGLPSVPVVGALALVLVLHRDESAVNKHLGLLATGAPVVKPAALNCLIPCAFRVSEPYQGVQRV